MLARANILASHLKALSGNFNRYRDNDVLHEACRWVGRSCRQLESQVMANVHQRTRSDHATELAEDYVEAIAEFVVDNGVCRPSDLVKFFKVTHATVNNTVGRLVRDGFVTTEPYRPLELTTKGKRLATKCRERHQVVEDFLLLIGVSKETAIADSEGIEHHVSTETLTAMRHILKHKRLFSASAIP